MDRFAELTRIDEGAVISPDGAQQVILVDENTHFGRSDQVADRGARVTPKRIHDARFAVRIQSDSISRNHAVMYASSEVSRLFRICDLNSLNRTYINDRRIGEKPVPIINDDVIRFGNKVSFEFKEISAESESNHAILVAHNGRNLTAPPEDAKDLRRELEKRKFLPKNIRTCVGNEATSDRILGILENVRFRTTRNGLFIMHFSGHGSDRIDKAEIQVERAVVKADEILSRLKLFRGSVLLVLDGCYTESFAKLDVPGNVAIIAHPEKAHEGDAPSTLSGSPEPFTNIRRGYTTRAIVKALQSTPNKIDLPTLMELVKKDPRIIAKQRVSFHQGTMEIDIPSVAAPKRKQLEPK